MNLIMYLLVLFKKRARQINFPAQKSDFNSKIVKYMKPHQLKSPLLFHNLYKNVISHKTAPNFDRASFSFYYFNYDSKKIFNFLGVRKYFGSLLKILNQLVSSDFLNISLTK